MFSIQEICDKYVGNLKKVRDAMDSTASFHPEEASIYEGLNSVEQQGIRETLQAIPWSSIREYLGKGTTMAQYLAADKIHDDLVAYSLDSDLCPLISAVMVNGWQGSDLLVDIPSRTGYVANEFASGALHPTETVETTKATLSPIGFAVNPRIGADLVEDTSFNGDLVSWHLKRAAQALGEYATNLAVTMMKTAADGWGTVNSGAAGADTTTWANIETALAANVDDRWPSNTVLINPEAWEHTAKNDIGIEVAQDRYWQPYAGRANAISNNAPSAGFDFRVNTVDFKLLICDANHAAYPTDTTAMTNCVTLVFDRYNSILTGRKRWMKIENYVQPFKDLAGATISCRQDSVSLYDDSIYVLTES